MIVSSIISIILNAIILRYVYELEVQKCECAQHWMHQFIKYFAPLVILMSFIGLAISQKTLIKMFLRNKILMSLLFLFVWILVFIYYIVLLVYFGKLVYTECKCSENWKRWSLLYPAIIIILVFIAFLIALIRYEHVIFSLSFAPEKSNKTLKKMVNKRN